MCRRSSQRSRNKNNQYMYKIGITGGIGSGKSTVCALLRERGVAVYDSDTQAKRLMAESDTLRRQIVEAFGAEW